MSRRTVHSSSHWGAFKAVVEDGRFVDVLPFERDPQPNDLVAGLPAAVHAPSRIDRPGRATVAFARKSVGEDWAAVHTHMSLFRGTPSRSYGKFSGPNG